MELDFNVINLINTVLCVIIVVVGIFAFLKSKRQTVIVITASFFLFFVSHFITFLGLDGSFEVAQIVVRIFAYLFALYSVVYIVLPKKISQKA